MIEFIRYCFINSFSFFSNITIHALLFRYLTAEQQKVDLGLISLYANLLTIPISFLLNYQYVFKKKQQSMTTLIQKFLVCSITFLAFFHTFHLLSAQYFTASKILHILITIICSLINYYVMSTWVFKTREIIHNKKSRTFRVIWHADDFGLCDEITKDIFDCIALGRLNRTSVICNTNGFQLAKKIYQKKLHLFDVAFHLNLVEGKLVSASRD